MKREFLKTFDLDDETISAIMAENGRDIEKHKRVAESYRADLDEAKAKIEEYSEVDVKTLTDELESLKTKYKQDTQSLNEKLTQQDSKFKVNAYLSQFKFASERIKNSIMADFMTQSFEFKDGKFEGADEYMAALKEQEPTSFVSETKIPQFSKGTTPPGQGGSEKRLEDMTYSEQIVFLASSQRL